MLETNEFYYLIDLHYSQTTTDTYKICSTVLLPYRFTLFSNALSLPPPECFVLLPYRFTLFSNTRLLFRCLKLFYYLIDLHYSQTSFFAIASILLFYYLIDLHYSQTGQADIYVVTGFTTL